MIRNDRPLVVNGASRAPAVLSRAGDAAMMNKGGAADEWRSRISDDRPVYGCPDCRETAMQFYPIHPSIPHRTDCFSCHACGTCWEV